MNHQSNDNWKRDSIQGKPEDHPKNRSRRDKPKDHAETLGEIQRVQTEITTVLSKLEERSGGVEYKLAKLRHEMSEDPTPSRQRRGFRRLVDEEVDRRAKRLEAEKGASSLELQFLSDGRAMLQIDSGDWIDLAWRRAQLLDILTTDSVAGPDGLMNWLPLYKIVLELQLDPKNRSDRHNVRNLIFRVRKILKKHACNPFYLQTDPRLGVRLAVRPELVTRHKATNEAGRSPSERPSGGDSFQDV